MRVYIIGSVGSGKTTLAKQIAKELRLPRFETDQFVWQRHPDGDQRKAVAVRDAEFKEAFELSGWVIDGVHIDWTDKGIEKADVVLFLDVAPKVRIWRIMKRFLRQKMGTETANYKPTLRIFLKMFGWNRYFEKVMKPQFLRKIEKIPGEIRIVKAQRDIGQAVKELSCKRYRMTHSRNN